jgi:hypothetical protein
VNTPLGFDDLISGSTVQFSGKKTRQGEHNWLSLDISNSLPHCPVSMPMDYKVNNLGGHGDHHNRRPNTRSQNSS